MILDGRSTRRGPLGRTPRFLILFMCIATSACGGEVVCCDPPKRPEGVSIPACPGPFVDGQPVSRSQWEAGCMVDDEWVSTSTWECSDSVRFSSNRLGSGVEGERFAAYLPGGTAVDAAWFERWNSECRSPATTEP